MKRSYSGRLCCCRRLVHPRRNSCAVGSMVQQGVETSLLPHCNRRQKEAMSGPRPAAIHKTSPAAKHPGEDRASSHQSATVSQAHQDYTISRNCLFLGSQLSFFFGSPQLMTTQVWSLGHLLARQMSQRRTKMSPITRSREPEQIGQAVLPTPRDANR